MKSQPQAHSFCSVRSFQRRMGAFLSAASLAWILVGCGGGSGGNRIIGRSDVYVGSQLSEGYGMGVDTSGGLRLWVTKQQDYMDCAYPSGQDWGAIFLTAGDVASAGSRKTYDYSSYTFLVIELKGLNGGEQVSVGVKTESDPDDGREPKYLVSNLTSNWQTFRIPLTSFVGGSQYTSERLTHLYIVCELVFISNNPETISFKNVHFE